MYNWEQIRDEVNRFIASIKFEREPLELYKPIRYTIEQSGKRVRPASLRKFQAKFADYLAEPFLFHADDVKDYDVFKCLPLYMVSCL